MARAAFIGVRTRIRYVSPEAAALRLHRMRRIGKPMSEPASPNWSGRVYSLRGRVSEWVVAIVTG